MSAPRLPHAEQMNRSSISDSRMSSGHRSPLILRRGVKPLGVGLYPGKTPAQGRGSETAAYIRRAIIGDRYTNEIWR